MFKRKKAQQNTAEYYEKLWLEVKEETEQIQEIVKAQSAIIHNFEDRIKSAEAAFQEGRVSLEDIQNLKKDLESAIAKANGKSTDSPQIAE